MTEIKYCFGSLCLAPGAWADWFSGIMSATAVAVALAGYFINDHYRRADSKYRDIETAQLIGLKVWKVLNSSHDIYRHVWNRDLEPDIGGAQADLLWRRIHPMVGLEIDEAARLNAEEMSLLVQIQEVNFLMDLTLVIARHESMVLSMKEYRNQYEDLHKMLPAPIAMNGRVGIHRLTEQEFLATQPYSNTVENLISSIRDMSKENVERCDILAKAFHPLMKSKYPKQRFIAIAPPARPGDVVTPPVRSEANGVGK
ncbi:hypothetical protein [Caulobacter segnis]|uniref:hypothetical protein n=1 Tax=Caulobacter segnis TaxID=88688 RepID=UPI00285F6C18|nr:hypothetical protein [Caulobacter segnis]MDR6627430.1 hypothetical protein [Caulobacter segnis]